MNECNLDLTTANDKHKIMFTEYYIYYSCNKEYSALYDKQIYNFMVKLVSNS